MARPGASYVHNVRVNEAPDLVMQRFVGATASTRDYTLAQGGPQTLILTRRFIPTWAIAVAIVGVLIFLIGLLALLYKETEVLTISVATESAATNISIAGTATPEMTSRVNAVLASLTVA
jgi:hypothetical protein